MFVRNANLQNLCFYLLFLYELLFHQHVNKAKSPLNIIILTHMKRILHSFVNSEYYCQLYDPNSEVF